MWLLIFSMHSRLICLSNWNEGLVLGFFFQLRFLWVKGISPEHGIFSSFLVSNVIWPNYQREKVTPGMASFDHSALDCTDLWTQRLILACIKSLKTCLNLLALQNQFHFIWKSDSFYMKESPFAAHLGSPDILKMFYYRAFKQPIS